MILSFRTDRSEQTVQTQIRLQSDQGLHCLPFKSKCNCRRKSMQEKESIMVLQCNLKIPSLGFSFGITRQVLWCQTVTLVTEFDWTLPLFPYFMYANSEGSGESWYVNSVSVSWYVNSVTRVTIRHHSASLLMPNSYPRDGIFNPHLITIKDSILIWVRTVYSCLSVPKLRIFTV